MRSQRRNHIPFQGLKILLKPWLECNDFQHWIYAVDTGKSEDAREKTVFTTEASLWQYTVRPFT